jgi:hypothetical protein
MGGVVMSESTPKHVWYPQEDPLRGDPESDDVLAILASLHKDVWSGNADTDKYWAKEI